MKIVNTGRIPVYLWADDVENEAWVQIEHLSNLPFAYHHIAIMPDCHSGYGMPIGGVLATENTIIPNAVGVDIGCGMCAMKTSLTLERLNKEKLKKVVDNIKRKIPLGFEHYKKPKFANLMPAMPKDIKTTVIEREYDSALTQIGTLGGGNHFIELQKDEKGNIWIMIHSGSRNLGKKVCDYYNQKARKLNESLNSPVPLNWDLAYLPLDEEITRQYIAEMQFCVEFALSNRKAILDSVCEILASEFKLNEKELADEIDLGNEKIKNFINIAHNYASFERHFGKDVIVHRKGATLAKENTIGIIPGSQGSNSYIVKGKGNPDSFNSCSHGAGRKMSRNKARENLDLQQEISKLEEKGIIHSIRSRKDLDEAASAYKDIDKIMEAQKDLVEICVKLSPLAVVKG